MAYHDGRNFSVAKVTVFGGREGTSEFISQLLLNYYLVKSRYNIRIFAVVNVALFWGVRWGPWVDMSDLA